MAQFSCFRPVDIGNVYSQVNYMCEARKMMGVALVFSGVCNMLTDIFKNWVLLVVHGSRQSKRSGWAWVGRFEGQTKKRVVGFGLSSLAMYNK